MKKRLPLLNVVVLIFYFSSCYTPRYVYSPSAHNVPVLTKKDDSKLALNYSLNLSDNSSDNNNSNSNARGNGFDVQAAHAFSDHWAIMVNYFNRTERNSGDYVAGRRDSVTINYKRHLTEIGAGYYHILTNNQQAVFQVFGGITGHVFIT